MTKSATTIRRGVARTADQSQRRMNKTERWYATHVLAPMVANGEINSWAFEGLKLRLADRTWYTPDFMVITSTGLIEFHEIKGSWTAPHQDDARVKLKVAAEDHPWAMFVAYEHKSKTWEWFVFAEGPEWLKKTLSGVPTHLLCDRVENKQ